MTFALDGKWPPFRAAPSIIVLHSTGAPNGHERVLETLNKRKLAVHLVIEQDGSCHQLLDFSRQGAHCSKINDISIGIEFVNPLWRGKLIDKERSNGIMRSEYVDMVNGRGVDFCGHTAAQLGWVTGELPKLCDKLGIQKRIPGTYNRFKTLKEAREFAGVMGHLHWPSMVKNKKGELVPNKWDPGTDILRAFQKEVTK